MKNWHFFFCGAAVGCLSLSSSFALNEQEKVAFFNEQVRPIIADHCLKCHGGNPEKVKAEFSLTSHRNVIEGGEFGPAGNIENPAESLLLQMISYKDDEHQMPPKGKLPEAKGAVLKQWAELGFPFDPATEVFWTPPVEENDPTKVNEANKNWWAYRPVISPTVPAVSDAVWSKNPIDAFVRDQLDDKKLQPNGPADRAALLRRTFYNLTGLPPTPEETRKFVSDHSPDAFERVVDDLLSRPQYGERWGRHWLDLVRFAESDGYERDSTKPNIWRYRDYVIKAFNDDTPYDQFILEQLAGDELPEAGADQMIATGYYRLGVWDDEPADRELNRFDVFDGIVATTGETFLGMTLGCARCHDHKIDPIPTADYYSFLSFFRNVTDYSKGKENIANVMGERDQEKLKADRREKINKEHRLIAQIYHTKNSFRGELARKVDGFEFNQLPLSLMDDLQYRFYRNTFKKLPDFDKLRAENSGSLKSNYFDIGVATRGDAMGMVFEGNLVVVNDGDYEFTVDSKDGSRLLLDGQIVVDHDGIHPAGTPRSATRSLKKGVVPIRFEYFNTTGEPVFEVTMTSGGHSHLLSVPDAFRRNTVVLPDSQIDRQTWAYTTDDPGEGWANPQFDDLSWKAGKAGFGRAGTPGTHVSTTWTTEKIWLRKDFTLDEVPAELTLSIHQDENAEVYINGKLLKKFTGYFVKYESIQIPTSLFKKGANTIAVFCQNKGGGQYIDVGLKDNDGVPDIGELLVKHGKLVLSEKQVNKFKDQVRQLEASRKIQVDANMVEALVVKEVGENPVDTYVLLRGNPHVNGDKVEPRFPSIVADELPVIAPPKDTKTTGRRLALAKWIADKENPLTARVMVNRIWQHHFGRGIVRSTSNFGRVGDLPTHPELLDWLAHDFMHDKNWSIKKMHKQILLSRTYQMSSAPNPENLAVDPQNNNMWRVDMRRLSTEEVRDSLISLTGQLNMKMAGPSFFPTLSATILATASNGMSKWGKSTPEEQNRRSVYIFTRRSLLDPMLATFDQADTDTSCPVRFSTTVPTQALTMLNGEFVNTKALMFAERLRSESDDVKQQVAHGLALAIGRTPNAEEIQRGLTFIDEVKVAGQLDDKAALDRFALLVMNLNEFIFLD